MIYAKSLENSHNEPTVTAMAAVIVAKLVLDLDCITRVRYFCMPTHKLFKTARKGGVVRFTQPPKNIQLHLIMHCRKRIINYQ